MHLLFCILQLKQTTGAKTTNHLIWAILFSWGIHTVPTMTMLQLALYIVVCTHKNKEALQQSFFLFTCFSWLCKKSYILQSKLLLKKCNLKKEINLALVYIKYGCFLWRVFCLTVKTIMTCHSTVEMLWFKSEIFWFKSDIFV